MNSRRATTITNVVFNYLQLGLTLIASFVLVPFYLKHLSVQLYGAWIAVSGVAMWLTALDPGIANVLTQKVGAVYGGKDYRKIGAVINAGILISFCVATAMFLFSLLFSEYVVVWLKIEEGTAVVGRAFVLMVGASAITLVAYSVAAINYGLQSSLAIGLAFLGGIVAKISVTICLLARGVGLISLPLGEVSSGVVILVVNVILLSRNLSSKGVGFSFRLRGSGEVLGLFSYSFGSRLSKIVTRNLDSFFVSRYLGQQTLSLFNLTARGPRLAENFVAYPVSAFRPALAHLSGDGDLVKAKNVILRLARLVFWGTGLIAFGFIAFNDDFVGLWVGDDLFAGTTISLLVCVGVFVSALSNVFGSLCFSLGNIKQNSVAEVILSVILVPLLLFGTKELGLLGAVLAPIVATTITIGWYYPRSLFKKVSLSSSDYKDLLREFVLTLASSGCLAAIFGQVECETWRGFGASVLAFVAVYALVLSLASRFFREEAAGTLRRVVGRGAE